MQAAPRAADDREAGVPRDPRRARRLAGAGLTALLHLAVIAALLRAGPSPPPAAAPGAVSVRLLPALAAPLPPPPTARPEPRTATPMPRAALRAPAVKPAATLAHAAPAPSAAASTAAAPDLTPSASPPASDATAAADPHAAAADDARLAAAYVQALWTQIAAARPTGTALHGEALVGFTLDADGRLVALELLQSSGNGLLDRLALRTVRRAAPFPPPPAAAGREFRIAFHFG